MASMYLFFVVVLIILAISDLVVGVSNDAVNFLNSAIGSRVAKMRTIMIIASLGVLFGAVTSGGMMEVARKGIFHPEMFYFSEIMIIFMAVMITDVILLDMFNSFGMPTSTTVSIVFELLGAAVAMSLIKVGQGVQMIDIEGVNGEVIQKVARIGDYINTDTALFIIAGILLSVVVAFSVGMIIQFFSRLLFSFDYKGKLKYYDGLWGGFALTAILYFILIKGAKSAAFMTKDAKMWVHDNTLLIIGASFVFWAILLQIVSMFTKVNVLKIIVFVGTFALAMAFSGNDLVNFIGVPLAAYSSYQLFLANGGDTTDFLMSGMAGKVETPTLFLMLAGLIMVMTLVFSKKAKSVIKTSLDLGRQDEGFEKFGSSMMARSMVRGISKFGERIDRMLPASVQRRLAISFDQKPFDLEVQDMKTEEAPAFDLLRAAVTLVVASILISIGTSLKLPLSTTYVTFMVAMGTSLADGAWGRESAVYRVSGVLSVIGGWFFTAFSAFSSAFVLVYLLYHGGTFAMIGLLLTVAALLYRSHIKHKEKTTNEVDHFELGDENTIDGAYIYDKGVKYSNRLFHSVKSTLTKSLSALERQDIKKLYESKEEFKIVFSKIKRVNNKVNSTITRLDNDSEESGINYIKSMYFLHEIALSNDRIIRPIYNYIDNSHKPLLPEQMDDLNGAATMVSSLLDEALDIVNNESFDKVEAFMTTRDEKIKELDAIRKAQVKRIKNKVVGTRNSVLFFDTVSELRHLLVYSGKYLESYEEFYNQVNENVS